MVFAMTKMVVEISLMCLYTCHVECHGCANRYAVMMRILHLFFIQVNYQLPWYITNLYVINIVKTEQTSVYFIFREGSVVTLFVRIFVVNVFKKCTYFYRLIILLLL